MRTLSILAAVLTVFLSGFAMADPRPSTTETPPRFSLRFTVVTGDDDLRGRGDNVTAHIYLHGRTITRLLNQRGMRWADHTTNVTTIPLPVGTRFQDMESIALETSFRGGIDGDNWNMNSVVVDMLWSGAESSGEIVIARHGFHRFTGERRSISMQIAPELPRSPRPGVLK